MDRIRGINKNKIFLFLLYWCLKIERNRIESKIVWELNIMKLMEFFYNNIIVLGGGGDGHDWTKKVHQVNYEAKPTFSQVNNRLANFFLGQPRRLIDIFLPHPCRSTSIFLGQPWRLSDIFSSQSCSLVSFYLGMATDRVFLYLNLPHGPVPVTRTQPI